MESINKWGKGIIPIKNVDNMMEMGKHHRNKFCRQESLMDIFTVSKYLPIKYLIISKEKNSNSLEEIPSRHHLITQLIKVNMTSKKTYQHHEPSPMMH